MTQPLQLIRTPADLRPGDLMLGPIGGAVGLGVGLGQLWLREAFRVGSFSVRHAAIVVQAATDELVYSPGYGEGHREEAPPRLVQAMPSGAEEVDLTFQEHWTERHAYVRLPEDYPGQAEDAAAIARLMVQEEVSYSFASYAYLGAWRWGLKTPHVERWINRRRPAVRVPLASHRGMGADVALPCEAICSVLVDQSWSLAGKRVVDGVARQAVTPGALAGQLWRRTGTTWALPRGSAGEASSWVVNGA